MPANWTTIENVLQAQIVRATGIAGNHVIWGDQKVPRPSRAFLRLKISDDLGDQNAETYQRNNPSPTTGDPVAVPPVVGTEVIKGTREDAEFTLTVQAFTETVIGNACARVLLKSLKNALNSESYINALHASGVALISCATVLNWTEVLETKFEGRASLEIRCRVEDGHEETTTFIETFNPTISIT